ncbi:hypothetical protein Gotri_006259 [Gossypium trilobum]|uniref:Uncharacterized protein n=1 Tax=Gossypium trilobum TaxID=34281 RepID=A0A7J9EZA9_9ROSI|nr:hypothetical protein [Gossypium trilobum]
MVRPSPLTPLVPIVTPPKGDPVKGIRKMGAKEFLGNKGEAYQWWETLTNVTLEKMNDWESFLEKFRERAKPLLVALMADPTAPPNPTLTKGDNCLKYTCDAGFFSNPHPSDTPNLDEEDSNSPPTFDSDDCDSDCDSTHFTDLSAGLRVFSDSILRMELAGMEMVKAMEASRCEAEKRRAESEAELTRMMLRTQSQIASFVAGDADTRKRKRGADDEPRDSSVR